MFLKTTLAAASISVVATGAFAQQFSGELTIDVYAFSEGDSLTATNYSGALEYNINRNFAVAADLASYGFSVLNESVSNFTLHGIYHLNEQSSVGVFVGSEAIGDAAATGIVGIEAGYETGQIEVEGYLGTYDNVSGTTIFGASGSYQFNDAISAIAEVGFADLDTTDVNRFSVGAEYEFASGPSVYAEVGTIGSDIADSAFIGLGASVEFGADRGTTFNRRSIWEAVNPGF